MLKPGSSDEVSHASGHHALIPSLAHEPFAVVAFVLSFFGRWADNDIFLGSKRVYPLVAAHATQASSGGENQEFLVIKYVTATRLIVSIMLTCA